MSLNLDLVIDTKEDSVDMKSALESMQGVSDAVRCAAEGILTGKAVKRKTHKGKVRTSLKKSFKGSYGHTFSLDVYDDELQKKLRSITRAVFVELLRYFINDALYNETSDLSKRAQDVLDDIGESSNDIVEQLRGSSLDDIHSITKKFNHDVKIRYRKSRDDITVLARFDRSTAEVLEATESDEEIDLVVSITRLNIHTGNGRLQIKGQDETMAFGFGIGYKEVALKAKRIFSENLNNNNVVDYEQWKYIKIIAKPIKLRSNKIVKYIVTGFYNE
jgi:ElaB/YqjD/DUF883 family membrane-anchored ribosome-binding protein